MKWVYSELLMRFTKTDQLRNGKHVFLSDNKHANSAASILKKCLELSGLKLGSNHFLFFPIKKGKSSIALSSVILSYSTFRGIVKKWVSRIGLDHSEFGTHSGRAGGATSLAPQVTEHELLVSGRWKDSRSICRYAELTDETCFDLNDRLQTSIVGSKM